MLIGLSAGISVSAGLSAFISELGIVSSLADRTHTADRIHAYENSTAIGAVIGNLIYFSQSPMEGLDKILPLYGILAGIFVGCWSMALTERLNIFPVFVKRLKIAYLIPYLILCMALGKGMGAVLFFINHW